MKLDIFPSKKLMGVWFVHYVKSTVFVPLYLNFAINCSHIGDMHLLFGSVELRQYYVYTTFVLHALTMCNLLSCILISDIFLKMCTSYFVQC